MRHFKSKSLYLIKISVFLFKLCFLVWYYRYQPDDLTMCLLVGEILTSQAGFVGLRLVQPRFLIINKLCE